MYSLTNRKIKVTVTGLTRTYQGSTENVALYKQVKNPVAIAIRYTNFNVENRKCLETSFVCLWVDDYTPDNLEISHLHPVTGHHAVCIYAFMTATGCHEFRTDTKEHQHANIINWSDQ